MQFANDENGVRTYILEAQESGNFFCPVCNAPMIQRRGQINIPHFAHRKGFLCSDNWKYEEMSEWHRSWQAYFPLENQEVAVSNDLGRHRADVLINDTVVEFQHSPMSAEEFQERNVFYTQCGYRVIWLFDAREAYRAFITADSIESNAYRWKHPPKTITGLDLFGSIQVFFHLQDETDAKDGVVIRLTWCSNGDLSRFRSAPSMCFTETEFVELASTGTVKRDVDTSGKSDLAHALYMVRRKNGEMECYDCPINEDGYAPQIREDKRVSCDQCPYFREYDSAKSQIKCAGRFRDYLDDIATVLETCTMYGDIYQLSYVAKNGSIHEVKIDMPDSPATSIIEIAKEFSTYPIIVQNIRTGKRFLIEKDIDVMLQKYSRIYGYYWNERFNNWSIRSSEIYGPWKPDWIPVWFK
jgi:ssDNA-binding Zn-finger/Zn-ribbon topoisomerase 1